MENNLLNDLNTLIQKLDSIIDILFQSTKQFIDTGNVNYELKNIINKLDEIIDSIDNYDEINMIETAKYDITYTTIDIIDNADIFDKINRLRNAKSGLIKIRTKLIENEHL